jgi:hypothetical protein
MPKSPEKFDFSKQEDQEEFASLPKNKQEEFIGEQHLEALNIKEIRDLRIAYEQAKGEKPKEIPKEVEKLLGGDLYDTYGKGKVSVADADSKEDVFAIILERSICYKGGAGSSFVNLRRIEHDSSVGYSVEIVVEKAGKIHHSGFHKVRGIGNNEKDDNARWWNHIKLLEVSGDKITLGVSTNDLIEIMTVDLKTDKEVEVAKINLAEERKSGREKKKKN